MKNRSRCIKCEAYLKASKQLCLIVNIPQNRLSGQCISTTADSVYKLGFKSCTASASKQLWQ
jgi:hypothetical protein